MANCFTAYAKLVQLEKEDLAYSSVLALYAIRQFHDGRRVGTKANSWDAYANGSRRQHLDTQRDQQWQESLVDTKSPVADQAAFHIDFPSWLQTLKKRNREVALRLCQGDWPVEVAREHNISRGRASRLRRELRQAWLAFHGENDSVGAAYVSPVRQPEL